MTGAELIAKERQRQIDSEGWDEDHDDEHTDGSLALAAVCYATPVRVLVADMDINGMSFRDPWPESWDACWDKRRDFDDDEPLLVDPKEYSDELRLDLLVKAGALLAAEIDRLQRAAE